MIRLGEYDSAIEAFQRAGEYSDAKERVFRTFYEKGEYLVELGEYDSAVEAFQKAGEYSDAKERILKTWYAKGEMLLIKEDYENAAEAFDKADSFSDAKEKAKLSRYFLANQLTEQGNYKRAVLMYSRIRNYKDVEAIVPANKDLIEAARSIVEPYQKKGNVVEFGRYEQDNNFDNGKEPIEWIVLQRNEKTVLLKSKYALDAKAYNEGRDDTTWEECSLRHWLNEDFFNEAFDQHETSVIMTVEVDNSRKQENKKWKTSGEANTQDKVFLLSYTEARNYFDSDYARRMEATPYAKSNNVYLDGKNGRTFWWLRSPGFDHKNAAYVNDNGLVLYYDHVYDERIGVSPVLWLNLESLIF